MMRKGQVKLTTLSILLLKEVPPDPKDGRPFGTYLREELSGLSFTEVPALESGVLYVDSRLTNPPAWLSFLEDLHTDYEIYKGASTSAVIFTRSGERTFAIVFGRGRSMLKMSVWDDGFGLKTALGLVERSKLKSIDKKTLAVTIQHARVQTALPGEAREFGLDVEQDLLRAVAGQPAGIKDRLDGGRLENHEEQGEAEASETAKQASPLLEELICGNSDTLTVTVRARLRDVPVLLDRYLDVFSQRKYQNNFPWIDKLAELTDRAKINDLESKTNAELSRGVHSGWSLVVPELIDWEETGGFSYKEYPPQDEVYSDLDLSALETHCGVPLSIDLMKRRQIYALNPSKTAPRKRWQSFKCLYGEIQEMDDVFVLSGGKWYRVLSSFVQQVNQEVKALLDDTLGMPAWVTADIEAHPEYSDTLKENIYCRLAIARQGGNWKLIDRSKIFYGGGASQIEFCDLVKREDVFTNFIFAKRYLGSKNGPGVLSHLFAQGYVAMSAIDNDKDFVEEVNKKLVGFWAIPQHGPKAIKATYLIITPRMGPIEEVLPFFSRLNLRNTARNLRKIGVPVSLCFAGSDEKEKSDKVSASKPNGPKRSSRRQQ